MKSILPAVAVAVVALLAPAAQARQDPSYDALLRQVDALQREVDLLQKEVHDLTLQVAKLRGPAPAPAVPALPGMADLEKLLEQFGGGGGGGLEGLFRDLPKGLDLDKILRDLGGADLPKLLEQLQGGDQDPPDLNRLLEDLQRQLGDDFDLEGMMDKFRESLDGEKLKDLHKMMEEFEKFFEDAPPGPDDETI